MHEIKRNKDGSIRDFSVPDAHTIYVTAWSIHRKEENGVWKEWEVCIKREAANLWSIDDLDKLHMIRDPDDKMILGHKWLITPEIVRQLKSKGQASQFVGGTLRMEYWLRKTKHADNLRHKG